MFSLARSAKKEKIPVSQQFAALVRKEADYDCEAAVTAMRWARNRGRGVTMMTLRAKYNDYRFASACIATRTN